MKEWPGSSSQNNGNVWYAQRRRSLPLGLFRLERNTDFSRCAMLLNAQISGLVAAS